MRVDVLVHLRIRRPQRCTPRALERQPVEVLCLDVDLKTTLLDKVPAILYSNERVRSGLTYSS